MRTCDRIHRGRTGTPSCQLAMEDHWSQANIHANTFARVIDPVSVSTVLLTSSEQDPLERHNHKLLAEHCDTRNFHEPLALLAASSVLAAFIMPVLPRTSAVFAKRLGSAWFSCNSCAPQRRVLYLVLWCKKVGHCVTIGIH